MHHMKHYFHAALMVHCLIVFPAVLVFLVYSVGAMILLFQWQLFLWGVLLFIFSTVIMAAFAILGE